MMHVILCGGTGSRLWPLSRECQPKQFIKLLDKHTLLQQTAMGNRRCCSELMVVCNIDHACLAQNQLAECAIEPQTYILEATPKNTAAAVCLALSAIPDETVLLLTPADHFIDYSEGYFQAITDAQQLAQKDHVVIFGIRPHHPETGYGYMELLPDNTVKRFHEKPDLNTATQYVTSGNFLWNSGMICAKANVLKHMLLQHAPDIYTLSEQAFQSATLSHGTSAIYKIQRHAMEKIPALSIDYALLEKMTDLKCVRCQFVWNDVGSFDALFSHFAKDAAGNALGAQNVLAVDSKNNLVIGNERMISTVDVEDLVIVDTPDALLITKRGSTQKVRSVVNQLQDRSTTLHKVHLEEIRPWGSFTVLEVLKQWKVKRLVIAPGKRLSLQRHAHRSEHWIVVSGTALVTIGKEQRNIETNQSVFIPTGEIHRIENPEQEDLVIIEVQFGSYTGEDDIERIEDEFVAFR